MKKLSLIALASAALIAPMLSHAESTTFTPAVSGSTAQARLDFKIVIPAVLFLRVGTGAATVGAANDTTVDLIDFTLLPANVGSGVAVAASAASGDLNNGAVTVRVFSNFNSSVTLNSAVTGQLTNAAADTIPWSQIAVTPGALAATTTGFNNVGITHPAFSATTGAGTPVTLATASKMVREEGKWTFKYSNTNVVPAGTYGALPGSNGRVTYTASQV